MPKFCEDFSETQRRAAIGYAIAHRSVPAAMRAAAAGQLPECPEPFTISKSYLSELVRDEKERRAEGAPKREASAAEIADDILRRELKRLDKASRVNRLNPQKARDMLRALREVDALTRKTPAGNGNAGQADDTTPAPETTTGILERLTEQARASTTEQSDDGETRDVGSEGSDDTAGRETQPDRNAERGVSAVRSRAENLSRLAAGV